MANSFDPNTAASEDSGIFGLPFTADQSRLVIIPVPWEATTSYGGGTSLGPALVLEASRQVDLFDLETKKAYECGYYMDEIPKEILELNFEAKRAVETGNPTLVNEYSQQLNKWVHSQADLWLKKGKIVAVLGGDHSSPFGLTECLGERLNGKFGILHIDAHADLRKCYQGHEHSHASIMNNVMNSKNKPAKLIQVGIRDFCEEEFEMIQSRSDIETHFDVNLQKALMEGRNWKTLCDEIVEELPKNVYISFDIDGLDPALCPDTGTPVPGGLSFAQAAMLIRTVVEQGKTIVGFDLNEVSGGKDSNEWNGNIGARILYKLCGWTMISNGFYKV
jgi:agmatinase